MSFDGASFGRGLRERRKALGLTQARVAQVSGVPAATVGRWERGESLPVPAHVDRMKEILRLSDAEAALWSSRLPAPPPPPEGRSQIAFEVDREIPDEWLPPRQRVRPPSLDREALQGRRRSRAASRHLSPVDGEPGADPFDVPEPQPGPEGLQSAGTRRRAALRRQRDDRRRDRLEQQQAARRTAEAGGDGAFALPGWTDGGPRRRRVAEGASRRMEGYLSVSNTGTSFPVTGAGRYAFPDGEEGPALQQDWPRYTMRTLALVLVLGVLAAVAVWALFELGEGWSAVIDLFRGSPTTSAPRGELTDAFGMLAGH